jgi:hypothetical protein
LHRLEVKSIMNKTSIFTGNNFLQIHREYSQ